MTTRNLFFALLATSILAACGDATTEDQPADPEFGLETANAKDDSFAVRPGSPEARAIVDYLNQPLADNAAGDAFLTELDSVLYSTAAKNIAAYRAGDDGDFGTNDDVEFDTIADVDRVRFVGRTALMRLLELAEANGYFQRATVDCADYLAHDRYNNYRVTSYADLLEVENSRCTTINGNLSVYISGTDLLPPSARRVDHLRFLRTINGNFEIQATNVFESIHLEGLETVTGDITVYSNRKHAVTFDALEIAKSIRLSGVVEGLFPVLDYNPNIYLDDSDLTGFTALSRVGHLQVTQRAEGTFPVDFPALAEAQRLTINVPRTNRYQVPEVYFTGGFAKLAKVDGLTLNEGQYKDFEWTSLETVDSLRTTRTVNLFAGMKSLVAVGSYNSDSDTNDSGQHIGPPKLATARSISVTSDLPVGGYDALVEVEQGISVTSMLGFSGFENVETVGGGVNLNIGRQRMASDLQGFNSAVFVGSIQVNANSTTIRIGDFFTNLENTGSSVQILANGGFDKNLNFSSLLAVGGQVRVDNLREGIDLMPVLEIVDGHVTINATPEVFTGFDNLEHIEGTLTLKRRVNTIDGFASLGSIGGNLSVPRTLGSAQVDAFLNQLEEFSGTINFN